MATLLDIYADPTIININTFEQALEGTGVAGVGSNTNASNEFKPTTTPYQSATTISGGPYDGATTYSDGGIGTTMTAGGGGHF
ncbi:hypothetical protein OAA15_00255 [bacterium]|nr:hypothetical protein [bacterium]